MWAVHFGDSKHHPMLTMIATSRARVRQLVKEAKRDGIPVRVQALDQV